jgi:large subunit ribosomal protein L34
LATNSVRTWDLKFPNLNLTKGPTCLRLCLVHLKLQTKNERMDSRTMKTNVRRSNLKKRRVSGFLARKRTKSGRKVLNRRRRRGRTATVFG